MGATGRQIKETGVFCEGCAVSAGVQRRFSTLTFSLFRYSTPPTLSLDGPLYLTAQRDAYKSDDFICFIDGLLDSMNPYPAKNSVIVMDNASIHKAASLRPIIEER